MKINEILNKSTIIRDYLMYFEDSEENPINIKLIPIPPYKISNNVKLIVIGQDPTIRSEKGRARIDMTLNLDKGDSLRRYIDTICQRLNIDFENIYGTNLFKYFYSYPPSDTLKVLESHLKPNLKLLIEEISAYPEATIITLGEPILKLLVKNIKFGKMTYYWDYNKDTRKTNGKFKFSKKSENNLGRRFFPLPHQPSLSKDFYKNTLDDYLDFVRRNR